MWITILLAYQHDKEIVHLNNQLMAVHGKDNVEKNKVFKVDMEEAITQNLGLDVRN